MGDIVWAVPGLVLFPLLLIFAAVSDALTMRIGNHVQIALVVAFPIVALTVGMAPTAIALHLALGAAVLSITFAMFAMGWMGGGDAKLIAATAVWFGPTALLVEFVFLFAIFGGVLTIAVLTMRRWLPPLTGLGVLDMHLQPGGGVPYGVALGAAGLMVYAHSPYMDAALTAARSPG